MRFSSAELFLWLAGSREWGGFEESAFALLNHDVCWENTHKCTHTC